ncbi:hypothetical protein HF329_04025 [Chitinophaga oryzae]|uniref:Lipocalin-like domain-containing protein n=1 Tax=Chitinophaga oryzae TaxID=2725414 RepID=A0AAE7D6Y9_9BACT|nr:hypothetical protein [Chitinophaga oryzae]QJB30511.1 hypothetical protein HF329_04025 [Chitinophaga oryzae]
MKKSLYLLCCCLAASCGHPPVPVQTKSAADSVAPVSPDSLSFSYNGLWLTATAGKDSITLTYQLPTDTMHRHVGFRYPLYTGVAFPAEGIAVLHKNGYTAAPAGLIGDSLLLLPLINHVSNGLSLYIINLRSGKVSERDYRTALPHVWLNEDNHTLLLSDSRQLYHDSMSLYRSYRCVVVENELEKQAVGRLLFPPGKDADMTITRTAAQKLLQ